MEIILTVATILGGIAAVWYFIDKWRVPSLPDNPSPSITGRAMPEIPSATAQTGGIVLPKVSEKQDVSESGHAETALPLEAVLEALHDPRTTALQKSQFTQRQE